MKKTRDSISDDHEKPLFRYGQYIGFPPPVLVLAFALSILNAAKLQVKLDRSTQDYLTDVTFQLSRDTRDAINNKITNLVMTADSFSQFTEKQDTDITPGFPDRAAQILEFRPLIFFDREGFPVSSQTDDGESPVSPEGFLKLPSVRASLQGNIQVNYMDEKSTFYSVPVYRDNGVDGVLVGVRNKENMQSLISSKSLSSQTLGCIMDGQGQVIISPTDLESFLQLGDISKQEENERIIIDIQEMQWDITKSRSGVLGSTITTEEELFLSYSALSISDQFLPTIIPADIISTGTNQYIPQSFIIIGAIILILPLFLFVVFRLCSAHKGQLELIAYRDSLTGGPNNAAFQAKYGGLSKDMTPYAHSTVLLSVRGFKMVNEQFGIRIGNQIPSYIYKVLKQHLHEEQDEFATRGESDHFFLCSKEYSPEAIQYRLGDMVHDINNFHDMELPDLSPPSKQDTYLADDPYQKITLLQDHVKTTLQGCGADLCHSCCFYGESLIRTLKIEQKLNALFGDSIKNRYFQIYLQPRIGLRSGQLKGAEALVR